MDVHNFPPYDPFFSFLTAAVIHHVKETNSTVLIDAHLSKFSGDIEEVRKKVIFNCKSNNNGFVYSIQFETSKFTNASSEITGFRCTLDPLKVVHLRAIAQVLALDIIFGKIHYNEKFPLPFISLPIVDVQTESRRWLGGFKINVDQLTVFENVAFGTGTSSSRCGNMRYFVCISYSRSTVEIKLLKNRVFFFAKRLD